MTVNSCTPITACVVRTPCQEGAPARRQRTLSRSIMRTPVADGAGDPNTPAPQRRERTQSVVWKDERPKGTPKSAPKATLSTVVTYAREPGTNARKVVRATRLAAKGPSCTTDRTRHWIHQHFPPADAISQAMHRQVPGSVVLNPFSRAACTVSCMIRFAAAQDQARTRKSDMRVHSALRPNHRRNLCRGSCVTDGGCKITHAACTVHRATCHVVPLRSKRNYGTLCGYL